MAPPSIAAAVLLSHICRFAAALAGSFGGGMLSLVVFFFCNLFPPPAPRSFSQLVLGVPGSSDVLEGGCCVEGLPLLALLSACCADLLLLLLQPQDNFLRSPPPSFPFSSLLLEDPAACSTTGLSPELGVPAVTFPILPVCNAGGCDETTLGRGPMGFALASSMFSAYAPRS